MGPMRTRLGRVAMVTGALLLALLIRANAHAFVILQSATVEGDVIGGGGATPVSDSDSASDTSVVAVASMTATADTGTAVAEDGTGAHRGTGRGAGTGIASTSVSGVTLSGQGSASALFEATGDMGTGSGIVGVDSEVFFRVVDSTVGYTFIGNLFDDYESPDQIQLRRLDSGPAGSPVQIVNNIVPSKNVTGTLQPGNYRLFANLGATEAGGPAQSPGSEDVFSPAGVPALGPLALGLLASLTAGSGARLVRRGTREV